METAILLLVIISTIFAALAFISSKKEGKDDKIQSAINEKFLMFQDMIHKTMENARKEVESSKDVMSSHSIQTMKSIKDMQETISKLTEQQKNAEDLGQSLKYLLQTPKLRGNYGEEVLEEMLERILPKGLWQRQYTIDGSERVDAVVTYKDVVIPIDAKFPREIYEKYLNAQDNETKKRAWKLYEDGIKLQINAIKNKYIKPHKGTTDFALMFIPSESIYYETIAERNFIGSPCEIFDYARTNKVIPVSPNTFYAFLQIVMMGIRNIDIIKSAKKLQEALIKLERNFTLFYAKYEDIGASLDKAQESFKISNTHIKRFKDTVDSTIRLELPDENVNLPR